MKGGELLSGAVPLICAEAVAVDLETTGLDTKRDRIVEIGAVPIAGGRIDEGRSLRMLVDPGQHIPASATAIHGIDDARVKGAVPVAEALEQLETFLGQRLIIGHSVAFDLAVLGAEAGRAGRVWRQHRALDTRLLAEIVRPSLPDFSLEVVADWLGIEAKGRHSALGDALLAARIFVALVPHLREKGIRTLAEAEAACRRHGERAGAMLGASWASIAPQHEVRDPLFARIDPFPYRHRVRDVMTAPPHFARPTDTLREAAEAMARERISSLFLDDEGEGWGIITERDVLRMIAKHGGVGAEERVAGVASRPLRTVAADAFVYRAIGLMDRLKVRHLGVTDDEQRLVGALSARDLLRLRASEAFMLGDRLDAAADVPELAAAWARLASVAAGLLAEEVDARQIAAVISAELGAATRRAAILAEEALAAEGLGPAPQPYAVLVLGSGGRGESLLAMDQDNAIVFAEGEPEGAEDRYFARLGALMADSLDAVGVPLCNGGVMARNVAWRGSLATWRERICSWVENARPQDLLNVDIFFDLSPVHGDRRLADMLLHDAYERASQSPAFAKLLAESNATEESAVGWFGQFRTEDGRLDLKKAGLFPIVSGARILAIRHHIAERSTPGRLAGLRARGLGGEADLTRLDAAHRLLMRHILDQQVRDIAEGIPPSNKVAVRRLTRAEQSELRDALSSVGYVQELVRAMLF